MKPGHAAVIALAFMAVAFSGWKAAPPKALPYDIVICADLSASNNGYLEDIREQIWIIVNGIHARHPEADVRIGVVGYGRPSFGGANGYVRTISNLTDRFDELCYKLYQLSPFIEKGDHFVPAALQHTLDDMHWSTDPDAVRRVYLIGNGSPYTGPINLDDVCETYARRGISVSAMYVEPQRPHTKNEQSYRKIADITKGRFFKTAATRTATHEPLGHDERFIAKMNNAFSSTMMFYTRDAKERKKFTVMTDQHILQSGADPFTARLIYRTTDAWLETSAEFDLVSYYLLHGDFPSRIHFDFLNTEEHLFHREAILDRARQKALARMRLADEIRYLFTTIRPMRELPRGNQLYAFVLAPDDRP